MPHVVWLRLRLLQTWIGLAGVWQRETVIDGVLAPSRVWRWMMRVVFLPVREEEGRYRLGPLGS
jgi:hypothetical protein